MKKYIEAQIFVIRWIFNWKFINGEFNEKMVGHMCEVLYGIRALIFLFLYPAWVILAEWWVIPLRHGIDPILKLKKLMEEDY